MAGDAVVEVVWAAGGLNWGGGLKDGGAAGVVDEVAAGGGLKDGGAVGGVGAVGGEVGACVGAGAGAGAGAAAGLKLNTGADAGLYANGLAVVEARREITPPVGWGGRNCAGVEGSVLAVEADGGCPGVVVVDAAAAAAVGGNVGGVGDDGLPWLGEGSDGAVAGVWVELARERLPAGTPGEDVMGFGAGEGATEMVEDGRIGTLEEATD